jgi:hypothetical protein
MATMSPLRRRMIEDMTVRNLSRSMAQAQSVDARNSSDLQNNKPMTAKRMKRMGYLSRTQRATGSKCSLE